MAQREIDLMSNKVFHVSRRAFCASSLGASAWVNAMNAQATWPGLADDVNTYLSFGEHRAGMPSEERTAAWIRQRLDKLGYQTEFQKFPIRTLLHLAPARRADYSGELDG